jgi:hypothetical protein
MNDYKANRFSQAMAAANKLKGTTREADGQTLLNRIRQYQSEIATAKTNEKKQFWSVAQGAYERAAALVPDVPSALDAARKAADTDKVKAASGAQNPQEVLVEALTTFYSGTVGRYTDAEQSLNKYIQSKGDKVAVAYFYLGASELSRFYRDGGKDSQLEQKAKQDLKEAKTRGVRPPDAKYISPKVLKAFSSV